MTLTGQDRVEVFFDPGGDIRDGFLAAERTGNDLHITCSISTLEGHALLVVELPDDAAIEFAEGLLEMVKRHNEGV